MPNDTARDWDFGPLDQFVSFHLRRVTKLMSLRYAQAVSGGPIPIGGVTVLSAIAANPGISQRDLTEATGLNKSTLVAIIDSFEAEGWAERRPSTTDRRRQDLYVTPGGRRMLGEMYNVLESVEDDAARHVGPNDRRELVRLLTAFTNSLMRLDAAGAAETDAR